MWVCLSDCFLSIVDDGKHDDSLVVRARRKGDIEKVFPEAKVVILRGRDYMYRAWIARARVADAIADHIVGINYSNFKNSVGDIRLHDAYHAFWSAHSRLQPKPPYMM